MFEKFGRWLMEDPEIPEIPTVREIVTGREKAPELSAIGSYALKKGEHYAREKIRNAIYPTGPEVQDQLFINDVVRRYLDGEDFGLHGEEVSISEIGGNYGYHYGNTYKIPKLSEIPKIFGAAYRNTVERFTGSQSLEESTQKYLELHEKAETLYQYRKGIQELSIDQEGRFEAYVQRALRSMRWENPEAWDIYSACVAHNSTRGEDDSFRVATERYHPELGEDIALEFA